MKDVLLAKGVVPPERYSLGAWVKDVADNAGVDIEIDKEFCDIYSKGLFHRSTAPRGIAIDSRIRGRCGFSQYIVYYLLYI